MFLCEALIHANWKADAKVRSGKTVGAAIKEEMSICKADKLEVTTKCNANVKLEIVPSSDDCKMTNFGERERHAIRVTEG